LYTQYDKQTGIREDGPGIWVLHMVLQEVLMQPKYGKQLLNCMGIGDIKYIN